MGKPKPTPPGPSPPWYHSPVTQRSSSASPCPGPSACEHEHSALLSHLCPGGAAVSGDPGTGSLPHHNHLMGDQAGEKSWARLKSLASPRHPGGSVEERPQPVALGTRWPCPQRFSPLCLPAPPALQPDPGGFPGSHSDPARTGRDRTVSLGLTGWAHPFPVGKRGARACHMEEVPSCPQA